MLACAAGCLSTEGFYRYQDAGATGAAGTGSAGVAGTTGAAGTTGVAGTLGTAGTVGTAGAGGSNPTGVAGAGPAGRGGATGVAGTTGAAGRGGTTGAAGRGGVTGTGNTAGGVLFMDNFEAGLTKWDFSVGGTKMIVSDGTMALSMNESAGDQVLGAAGLATWTDMVVEARVKVIGFSGSSSSDVAAICARLSNVTHFYYFAIQADGKAKIKIQNDGNSSLGSSIDIGFQPGTWYTMKLQVVGNTLTAFVNGTQVGTFTATEADQILTAGGVGLMVQRTNAVFDDVVVRAP